MRHRLFTALIAASFGFGVPGPAAAALVAVSGGTSYTLPGQYDNLTSAAAADPWSPGTVVATGATLTFASAATQVILTFIGNEAVYANTFGVDGAPQFQNGTTTPGSSVTMSIADFLAGVFKSKGTGAGYGASSERVAISFAGNVLQLGFNDSFTGDADFDDMRLSAQVVPVPAALPLLGTAIVGLWGARRWRQRTN